MLIALFFSGLFVSCNDDGSVGLDLLPNADGIGVHRQDTFTLVTYTIREDSLESQLPPRFALGEIRDPLFGVASSGIVFQVRLTNENINLGENIVADSLVMGLSFDINNNFYGDTLDQLLIKVYELDEDVFRDSIYFSNHVPQVKPTPLASYVYSPRPTLPVQVNEPQLNGIDSVFNYAPLVRIPFGQELIDRLVNASNTPDLQNNTNFLNFFKGVYITAERVDGGSTGSVMHLVNFSARNGLFLYYKSEGQRRRFDMMITNESARRNVLLHDYSQTIVGDRLNDRSELIEETYVQAGGGVKTILEMPYLRNLVANNAVAINKAEIVFKIAPGTTDDVYRAPARMFLLAADSLGKNATILTPDVVEPYYDGQLRNDTYTFVITRYIQQILRSNSTDFGMVLIPNNTVSSLNRVVLGSTNNSLYQPKMVITFTKLK
ncbi:MAG: DUF4270 domain-containing protein [Bacteroidia bacterium]